MTDPRKRHGQRVVSCTNGDCFRASMSYLLDLPNDDRLPHDVPNHYASWCEFLWPFGLDLKFNAKACWVQGLWIASVPSKNCPGATHAIVMDGHKVEFDPSPKRRYHRDYNLLGKDVVLGGYVLTVTDARKLHLLDKIRRRM